MRTTYIRLMLLIAVAAALNACQKSEGEGGSATITGKVYNIYEDHNGKFISREVARETNVYVIYGNNTLFDDDTDTDPSGDYQFSYLRTGNYKVFAYQDCNTCDSGVDDVEVSVELTDKHTAVEAPDIELSQILDLNDGSSTITGRVVNTSGPKYDWRVFIQYDTDNSYFDDFDTDLDGKYQFTNLIPGSYTVYAITWDLNKVKLTTVITAKNQTVSLPDLVI